MNENIDDEMDASDVESVTSEDTNIKPQKKTAASVNKNDDDNDTDSDGESIAANSEDEDDDDDDENDDDDNYLDDGDGNIVPKQQNNIESGHTIFDAIEDDEDEEEDDDKHYLQKFDADTQKQIIADFHPELHSHNYDEIDILARVVRDEHGNIIDPLHKTLPFISRYEKARILGERAKQLNAGGKSFVEIDPTVIDGYLIAMKEYEEKKIPFIIKRPLPNGGVEYWKFADLEILA
jgi:DNA-directed RNA polymerase subunit K/omega